MEFSRKILSSDTGFDVISSDKFKSESVTVLFNSPLDKKRASYTALLMNVLMRGCVRYPTVQHLSRRLDELYDASLAPVCFKRGENHICGFSFTCLKKEYTFGNEDIFSQCLDVLYDVLTDPITENGVFSAEYVECEAANLISGIKAKKNDKISYAPSQCVKIMCGAEPYSADESGDCDIISEITPTDLYCFYKNEFVKFGCEVFYIGTSPDNAEKFADTLGKHFIFDEKYRFVTASVHKTAEVKRVKEIEDVSQGKLSIGFTTSNRLSDGDYYKYTMFAEVFSNSPSSRLFKNVREKLSLCYYCRCVTDPHKGIAVVSLGIDNENAEKAENEILRQIKMLASGDVSDEELILAKLTLSSAYREIYDTPAGMINWYYNRLCAGGGDLMISPMQNAAYMDSLTAADIAECASGLTLDTVYIMEGGEKL